MQPRSRRRTTPGGKKTTLGGPKSGMRQGQLFDLHASPSTPFHPLPEAHAAAPVPVARKAMSRPGIERRDGFSVIKFGWAGIQHEMAFSREEVPLKTKKRLRWNLSLADVGMTNTKIYRIMIQKAIIEARKNGIHELRCRLDYDEYKQARAMVEVLLKLKFVHTTDHAGVRSRENEIHIYTLQLAN